MSLLFAMTTPLVLGAGLLIWDGPFSARLNGPSIRGLYGP